MREADATYVACAIKTMAAIFKEFANREIDLQQDSLRRDLRTLFDIENYRRVCENIMAQAAEEKKGLADIEQPTLDFLYSTLKGMKGPLFINNMVAARTGWQDVVEKDSGVLPREGGYRVHSELEALSNVFFSVGPILQYATSGDPGVADMVKDIVKSAMEGAYANLERNLRLASIAYRNAILMHAANMGNFEKTKKEAFEGIYGNGSYRRLKECIEEIHKLIKDVSKDSSKTSELSALSEFEEIAVAALDGTESRDGLARRCLGELAALDGERYQEVQRLAHDAIYGEGAYDALFSYLHEMDNQIGRATKTGTSEFDLAAMIEFGKKVKGVLAGNTSYDVLRCYLSTLAQFDRRNTEYSKLRRAAHDAVYGKDAYDSLLKCITKAEEQINAAKAVHMADKKIAVMCRFRDSVVSVLDGEGSYDELGEACLEVANLAEVSEEDMDAGAQVSEGAPSTNGEAAERPAGSKLPERYDTLYESERQQNRENKITDTLAEYGGRALLCKSRSEGYGLKIERISVNPQQCEAIAKSAVKLIKNVTEMDISKQLPENLLRGISSLLLQILDQDLAGLMRSTLPFLPPEIVKFFAKRLNLKDLLSKEYTVLKLIPAGSMLYKKMRESFLNNIQGWRSVLEFVPMLPRDFKTMDPEQQANYVKQLLESATVYIQATIRGYVYDAYVKEYKDIAAKWRKKYRAGALPDDVVEIRQDPIFDVLTYGVSACSTMEECAFIKSMEYLPELNVLEFFIDEFRKKLVVHEEDMQAVLADENWQLDKMFQNKSDTGSKASVICCNALREIVNLQGTLRLTQGECGKVLDHIYENIQHTRDEIERVNSEVFRRYRESHITLEMISTVDGVKNEVKGRLKEAQSMLRKCQGDAEEFLKKNSLREESKNTTEKQIRDITVKHATISGLKWFFYYIVLYFFSFFSLKKAREYWNERKKLRNLKTELAQLKFKIGIDKADCDRLSQCGQELRNITEKMDTSIAKYEKAKAELGFESTPKLMELASAIEEQTRTLTWQNVTQDRCAKIARLEKEFLMSQSQKTGERERSPELLAESVDELSSGSGATVQRQQQMPTVKECAWFDIIGKLDASQIAASGEKVVRLDVEVGTQNSREDDIKYSGRCLEAVVKCLGEEGYIDKNGRIKGNAFVRISVSVKGLHAMSKVRKAIEDTVNGFLSEQYMLWRRSTGSPGGSTAVSAGGSPTIYERVYPRVAKKFDGHQIAQAGGTKRIDVYVRLPEGGSGIKYAEECLDAATKTLHGAGILDENGHYVGGKRTKVNITVRGVYLEGAGVRTLVQGAVNDFLEERYLAMARDKDKGMTL